ncbi:recombinase family protein [Halocynthiibacter namhaensis]|uniref:recombinase family protein n=1 Tax=Halocynthiibacter namhaensis TaxID=1290553 RepID=UPI000AD606E4|nr:recombinase family protein [Halocynthiibacter namhaensis]
MSWTDGDYNRDSRRKAAQYVRMSTEHQRYSTENQSDAIALYAKERGYVIVETYSDAGKSGLQIKGRDGLTQLLTDIQAGQADFKTVLVYDISRWGRFQDADESAYYEYICKRAGISIEYCAEQFENDGSPVSTIVKGVKRAMAGEYSRELSQKVFAGQSRLIEIGYRQGGAPGFGLRRMLIDEAGKQKGILTRGEHKSIQTDRVTLVPGPDNEISVVNAIFHSFVKDGQTETMIAADLNAKGIKTDLDRDWTPSVIRQLLSNEKYIGNNIWNRKSFKLKKRHIRNAPHSWVRSDGAFEAIVDAELFAAARAIFATKARRYSDEEMLDGLRDALETHGFLSGVVINETKALPSSGVYQSRFGSLLRAYKLVGFTPDTDYRYIAINKHLRKVHSRVIRNVVDGVAQNGGHVQQDANSNLLRINHEFSASVVIARCRQTNAGSYRWNIRLDTGLVPDITVVVRMDQTNEAPLDYYLLPTADMTLSNLRLSQNNGLSLDAYRFDDLTHFFAICERTSVLEIA